MTRVASRVAIVIVSVTAATLLVGVLALAALGALPMPGPEPCGIGTRLEDTPPTLCERLWER